MCSHGVSLVNDALPAFYLLLLPKTIVGVFVKLRLKD
jgi:hypothetical protein